MDLTQYKNKYVFSEWEHNEGFKSRWLRRITRTTKTQLIADVQRISDYKVKPYQYKWFQECAFRMNVKNGEPIQRLSHLAYDDGIRKLRFVDNFNMLKCKDSFKDIFQTDIRKIYPENHHLITFTNEFIKEEKIKIKKDFWLPTLYKIDDDFYKEIIEHFQELFGNIPVYKVKFGFSDQLETVHTKSIFSDNCIFYHITHHGNDKLSLNFDENRDNTTICFWLFDDKIIFQFESGIKSW